MKKNELFHEYFTYKNTVNYFTTTTVSLVAHK